MTSLPNLDQIYWEEINEFLSQFIAPQNGGIHFWDANNPQPLNLTQEDEGLTGWNTSSSLLERWNGTNWLTLNYTLELLQPFIYQFLNIEGNNLTSNYLSDIVTYTFNNWNPTTLPQWIINAFNQLINNIPLDLIIPLLNTWTPDVNSPLSILITQASLSGGLTPTEFQTLFNTWTYVTPNWIINYITALLANKSWSNTPGEASYTQLLSAFTEWFNSWLQNDINSRLSFNLLEGSLSFQQIQSALDTWYNNHLKSYIDNGDLTSQQYMINIFSSLETKVDNDYNFLLDKVNTHTHNS